MWDCRWIQMVILWHSTDLAEVLSATFASVFPNKTSWALCIASGLKEEESDEHWVEVRKKKKRRA